MTVPHKTSKKQDSSRLTRDDWLDAAFSAVVEGGFDSVRVLVLADKLGVTRGSFYWHFTDHAALIQALVARWRDREVALDQSVNADVSEDPKADLLRLLDLALSHAGVDLENMRFELALRGLGRRDPAVAGMLADIDSLRLRMFNTKFVRLTRDPAVSGELASLFYLAIVGSNQALSRPGNAPQTKEYLKSIISKYLIDHQVSSESSG